MGTLENGLFWLSVCLFSQVAAILLHFLGANVEATATDEQQVKRESANLAGNFMCVCVSCVEAGSFFFEKFRDMCMLLCFETVDDDD